MGTKGGPDYQYQVGLDVPSGVRARLLLGDESERQWARDELEKTHQGIGNIRVLDDATVAKAKI